MRDLLGTQLETRVTVSDGKNKNKVVVNTHDLEASTPCTVHEWLQNQILAIGEFASKCPECGK